MAPYSRPRAASTVCKRSGASQCYLLRGPPACSRSVDLRGQDLAKATVCAQLEMNATWLYYHRPRACNRSLELRGQDSARAKTCARVNMQTVRASYCAQYEVAVRTGCIPEGLVPVKGPASRRPNAWSRHFPVGPLPLWFW